MSKANSKQKEVVETVDGGVNDVMSKLDALYKKYPDSYIEPPEDLSTINVDDERLNCPFISFYKYLGGGPALGKITTYSGFFSTAKTSLAMSIAGANPDKLIGFVDCEYNWVDSSYLWAERMYKIDKERIKVLQPDFLEEGAEMVADLCDICDMIIYDGFDAISPSSEFEGGMKDQQMGAQARAYKKFFRKTTGKIYKTNTALIITNHLYDQIGNMYEPIKEPGGKSIGDFPSQKLWMNRTNESDKVSKEVYGQNVNIEVRKDKLTGHRGAKFSLYYDNKNGFEPVYDLLNCCEQEGLITRGGSWYSYEGNKIGQGEEKAVQFLKDNEELYNKLFSILKEKYTQ